jgi:PIN domain nuclease of toxin-antitoxin system
MKYLVDTPILLWSFIEPEKLTENIRSILLDEDNDVYYSPINLWKISIKYGLKIIRPSAIPSSMTDPRWLRALSP